MMDPSPWMFSTLPKAPQPLSWDPQLSKPSILRLQQILEEEDKVKKEAERKGKRTKMKPITKTLYQFMVQQAPPNPLT